MKVTKIIYSDIRRQDLIFYFSFLLVFKMNSYLIIVKFSIAVDLQCFVYFNCTAKGPCHTDTHTHIYTHILYIYNRFLTLSSNILHPCAHFNFQRQRNNFWKGKWIAFNVPCPKDLWKDVNETGISDPWWERGLSGQGKEGRGGLSTPYAIRHTWTVIPEKGGFVENVTFKHLTGKSSKTYQQCHHTGDTTDWSLVLDTWAVQRLFG